LATIVESILNKENVNSKAKEVPLNVLQVKTNVLIKEVTKLFEDSGFNVAISKMMSFSNELQLVKNVSTP
jgi:leucyl-tRNA synthetase